MNLNYQRHCEDNPINGMYGIICECSIGKINNNFISNGIAGLNIISNSIVDIKHLTCNFTNNIINTAFNSLTTVDIESLVYNKNNTNLFQNSKNSFVNFSTPKFLSYEYSTGGNLISTSENEYEYIIDNTCKWSSIFGNDGGVVSGYMWTDLKEFLQDSTIENLYSFVNNEIKWSEAALFPYLNSLNKKLPIGNSYNVTFNFLTNNYTKSESYVDFNEDLSFSLTNFNDSTVKFINSNDTFKINFNGKNKIFEINLENLKNITFENFMFSNCILNIKNCNIFFKNCIFSNKFQINSYNSKISILLTNNITDILSIFNKSNINFNNSNIYIENDNTGIVTRGFLSLENHLIKCGWRKLKENFGDTFTGALINHTHKFLSFQNNNNTQIIIKELITGNTPTVDPDNPNAIIEHIYKESINGERVPILLNMPIGACCGWYQIKQNNKWIPEVPYGFYELTNEPKNIAINSLNPNNVNYNYILAKLLFDINNTTNDNEYSTFLLPALAPIYNDNNHRIIFMIKYNFNIILR